MIVTCPSCNRKYSVDDSKMRECRKVRCAVCQYTWQFQPTIADDPILHPKISSINDDVNLHTKIYSASSSSGIRWFSIASVVLIFGAMLGFFLGRDYLATYIPQTRQAYDVLNLNYRILIDPVKILNVAYSYEDGRVKIAGDIQNDSTVDEKLDVLVIKVTNKIGLPKPMFFLYRIPQEMIFAKGTMHFATTWYDIPFSKFFVDVSFKDPTE